MRKKKIILLSMTSAITVSLGCLAVLLSHNEKPFAAKSDIIEYPCDQYFRIGDSEQLATASFGDVRDGGYYPLTLTGRNSTNTYDFSSTAYDSENKTGTYIYIEGNSCSVEIIDGMPSVRFISCPCSFSMKITYDLYENASPKKDWFVADICFYDDEGFEVDDDYLEFDSIYGTNTYYVDYEYECENPGDDGIWTSGGYFSLVDIILTYECEE